MKRAELVRQLESLGAVWLREGASHTIYKTEAGLHVAVPRHAEINEHTARAILREARWR